MKKGWIIALAVFLLLIGVAVGISVYNKGKTDEINIIYKRKYRGSGRKSDHSHSAKEAVDCPGV